jgi:two-component system response regulator DesR
VIRVLLVHDTHLMRSALVALLAEERDLEVVPASWRTAPSKARSLQPHVCVVDVECPGSATLSAAAEFAKHAAGRGSALLVLATASRPGLLRRAFDARALGYVNKDAGPERLLTGIRKVA